MKITGNYTALVTPLNKNNSVDYACLNSLIDFQIENGSSGIVILGSTAEAHFIKEEDKSKITKLALTKCKNKIDVIVGICSSSVNETKKQMQSRLADGANCFLLAPPSYIKPTQNGIYNFYSSLARCASANIIIYNIPSRVGVNIEIDTLKKLFKFQNIIGIKEASGNIEYCQKIILSRPSKNFSLIVGNDTLLLPMLSIGAEAVISVLGNLNPNIFENVIKNYSSNPLLSQKIFYQYYSLIDALQIESNPIPIKYVLSKINKIKPYIIKPLTFPTKKHKIILDKITQKYYN